MNKLEKILAAIGLVAIIALPFVWNSNNKALKYSCIAIAGTAEAAYIARCCGFCRNEEQDYQKLK